MNAKLVNLIAAGLMAVSAWASVSMNKPLPVFGSIAATALAISLLIEYMTND